MLKSSSKDCYDNSYLYYKRLEFVDTFEDLDDDILKIAVFVEGYRANEYFHEISAPNERLDCLLSGNCWIDIANKTVSKGAAMMRIMEITGSSYETTMAFGDYLNDESLIRSCKHSYAMSNAHLIDELKGIVDEMQGERFGLVIFNTSPVLLVPLTDDYEYIIEQLDVIQTQLERRWEDPYYEDPYITSGTLIGSDMRGSSLIGDGLAAAVFDFSDLEENTERTRLIIFSTDNELNGTPFISLDEAAQLCVNHNVQVYGIGVKDMNKKRRAEMQNASEVTGGKFYEYGISGDCSSIVADIERETKSFINQEPVVKETELVRAPFVILLACTAAMMVFTKVAKY